MEWSKWWAKFVEYMITNNGYKKVLDGLLKTLEIAVFGLLIGIVIGTLIAIIKVMPKTNVFSKILDKIGTVYVAFFRGTPMVVQLLIFHYLLFPVMGIYVDSVMEALITFGLNSGAYVSEIMRGGINSVDKGQMEAGRAMGLTFWASMFKIVIPQAIKNVIPTLGNEFISLLKETSVVSFIGVVDLYRVFQTSGGFVGSFVIPYIALAIIYILMIVLITLLIRSLERRFKKNER